MPNPLVGMAYLGQGMALGINDVAGPAVYKTGGVQVSTTVVGLTSARWFWGMLSKSGNYYMRIWSPNGELATSYTVQFYNSSGEVANNAVLSGETFRMLGVGVG